MRFVLTSLSVILLSLLTGCASSGRPVIGVLSYSSNRVITDRVLSRQITTVTSATTTKTDAFIEAVNLSHGPGDMTVGVGVDLLKLDTLKNMTWGDTLIHFVATAGDAFIAYKIADWGYDAIKDDPKKEEKSSSLEYANPGDTLAIVNGSGTVSMSYSVMQGSPKPDNIYVSNAGGTVSLDVKELPME